MQEHLIKILLIINFSLISLSVLILKLTKTNGYELSIYTAIPSYVWYFLVLDIFFSICIIVYQSYTSDFTKPWWIVGISTIMLCNMIILLLPVFRGYEIYGRWDILTHVGYVKDIIQFNEVSTDIIYPATHILIASISMISNIGEVSIFNYFVPFFLELYVLYIYCLARTVFTSTKERIISMVAGSVLFFSYTNYQVIPFTLSILLLPMVLYAYLNIFDTSKGTQFKIIVVIFIIVFPFFHPLTMLILVVTFLGTYLMMVMYNKIYNRNKELNSLFDNSLLIDNKRMKNAAIPALIGIVVFISWISGNYKFWNNNLYQVTNWFLGEATQKVTKNVPTIFEKLNMNKLDIFELFIKIYGHIFIYIIFSLIAGFIILRRIWRKDKINQLFFLLGWFSIYNLFLIVHIFSTVLKFGFWRIIAIVTLSTPIFVGYVSSYIINNKIYQKIFGYMLVMILIISSTIGIFNTFPSPYTLQTNQQVTRSEIVGMDWYYSYKNINYKDLNIRSCFRFADFVLGYKKRNDEDIIKCEREDTIKRSLKLGLVPRHFAYTNFSIFSEFINSDKKFENFSYMPIFKYEKIYYSDMYPQLDEFNRSDFEKLNYDISLEKIYDDNGVEIWNIMAKR